MALFTYSARTKTGERVEGSVEAPDRRAAMRQIEGLGHTPIAVNEGMAPSAAPPKPAAKAARRDAAKPSVKAKPPPQRPARFSLPGRRPRRPRMKSREVLFLSRELSDLLTSGMTLGNALNTLSQRKTGGPQDLIVEGLRDDIIRGSSLSDALARYPETFSTLYVSLVRAGEAAGELAEALERINQHSERVQEAREKVLMALTYPSIVLIFGVVTVIFSMIYVIPKFSEMFATLGSTLPLPTRILIGISQGLLKYGLFVAIALGIGVEAARRALRTEAGALWRDRLLLRMPVLRGIVAANAYAHFARTLGALLNSGVPVLQALSIVESTAGNLVISREIREARERVTDGSSISGPLAAGAVFPRMLTDMLAVGEQSGDMPGALKHIARRYDSELDRNVTVLTNVLEPLLILFIAGMVGFVAISMLLAVFDLTSGLGQ